MRARSAAALLGALLLVPATAAAAPPLHPCPGQKGFGCGTLQVPLDRADPAAGSIALHFAVQDTAAARRRPGLLVALTGGPGQSGVSAASSFAVTLKPLLVRDRLVTLDQRGTGASGALRCPAVQALDEIQAFLPQTVAQCVERVGASRAAHYATADTVADLDALRVAFGAPKLALMGVSYGTFVAQQYARVHPEQTERLVLDSVVAPDGVDPFLLDTYSRLGRVLAEQCAAAACRGATQDPLADVATLAGRLVGSGRITATTFDARGHPRRTSLTSGEQLLFLLIAGDLNPYLQAALPGALGAAAAGDAAPLARLVDVARGAPTPVADLSGALNVITGCEDVHLPWSPASAPADRPPLADAAARALDPALYAPFDLGTVVTSGYVDDCVDIPAVASTAPSTAPLPDVPTLLLSGRLDLRTPLENAEQVQAERPDAARVTVPGTGHDELDSDQTGCAERALTRWAAGQPVGTPCAGRTNAVAPFPRPPLKLTDYRSAPGVGGTRGRVLFAALDALADARVTFLQELYGGLAARSGGLRGGRYMATSTGSRFRLTGWSYLRGVRVSGTLHPKAGELVGRVAVDAGAGRSGALTFDAGGGVSGRLGGRAVRLRTSRGGSAAAARAQAPLAARVRGLRVPAGLLRRPRP